MRRTSSSSVIMHSYLLTIVFDVFWWARLRGYGCGLKIIWASVITMDLELHVIIFRYLSFESCLRSGLTSCWTLIQVFMHEVRMQCPLWFSVACPSSLIDVSLAGVSVEVDGEACCGWDHSLMIAYEPWACIAIAMITWEGDVSLSPLLSRA